MGIMDFVKQGVQEICIARPDQLKNLIVYKHPDETVPFWSQLTVDADECAVFFKDGQVMGVLGPGRHTLSTQNIPFLSNLVDRFTGGNVFKAEVFFVTTRPLRGLKFGGRFDNMVDPVTQVRCNPRIFGEYAAQITDPTRFIVGYTGMRTQEGSNEEVMQWVAGQFMMEIEQIVADVCMEEKVSLNIVGGKKRELTNRFKKGAAALDDIGIQITDIGRFKLTLDPKDQEKIDKIFDAMHSELLVAEAEAKKKDFADAQQYKWREQYANLAGQNPGYMAAAQADAMRSAGEGMAKGGGEGGGAGVASLGAQMAMGVGMAGMFHQGFVQPPQYQRVQAPAGGGVSCSKCGATSPGGKFCANCGSPLAPPQPPPQPQQSFCTNCGQPVSGKFCAGCGTPAPTGGAPSGGAPPAGGPPPGQGYPPTAAPQQGAPQQGYPPAAQPPQRGAPPAGGPPPGQGYPPAAQPPQQGTPPAAAPPQQGTPPAAAPPQQGYPPTAAPQGDRYAGGTPAGPQGGGRPGGNQGGGPSGGGQQGSG